MIHRLTFLSQHKVFTLRHRPCQQKSQYSITTSNQIGLIHLFPHSILWLKLRADKSQLFPSCLPQYKQTRSFTRLPSLTTRAGICKPMSRGRIHREGGGRWACVCMACVWRQYTGLPRAQTVILMRRMSNILLRPADNQTSLLETMFLLCRVKSS